MQIGVLGATGPAGAGLAARLAGLGHEVLAGSRDPTRAETAVAALRERWGDRVAGLQGAVNADACAASDAVVLAVNADAAIATAADLAALLRGRVLVSMANELVRQGREFRPRLPPEGSVAAAVQKAAPEARVVAAWQHVPGAAFAELDRPLRGDVVVCADDEDARATVFKLTTQMRDLRPLDAGTLANATGIEAFAAVLLTLNLRYRAKTSLGLLGLP